MNKMKKTDNHGWDLGDEIISSYLRSSHRIWIISMPLGDDLRVVCVSNSWITFERGPYIYFTYIYIYLCVYMCCMYVYIYVTCGYLYIFIYVIFNFTLTLCDHIHLYSQSGWFGPFFQGSQTTFFTNLRPWCQLLAVKGFWMRRYLRLASKAYGIFV